MDSTAGGTSVVITGTDFSGSVQVYFGMVPAASFVVNSATQITTVSPSQAVGTIHIVVETYSGTSSGVTFTYYTNHAPAAVNDSYSVSHDTRLTTASSGVRGNDTESDSDPLFVSWYSLPSHGTLTVLGDGSFIYRPTASYVGSDSFTCRVSDGTAQSSSATVSISVTNPLLALGVPQPGTAGTAPLTREALQPILDEAIRRWAAGTC